MTWDVKKKLLEKRPTHSGWDINDEEKATRKRSNIEIFVRSPRCQ